MFDKGKPDFVKRAHLWTVQGIKPGTFMECAVLGPMVCPLVHWSSPNTKPCVSALTNRAVLCRCDMEPLSVRRVAYLPVMTNAGERVVVILSNSVASALGDVPQHKLLKIARTTKKCAPLVVNAGDANQWTDVVRKRMTIVQPQDIREYLLKLWNIPALTAWCEKRRAEEGDDANSVDATPPARESDNTPSLRGGDPMLLAAHRAVQRRAQ